MLSGKTLLIFYQKYVVATKVQLGSQTINFPFYFDQNTEGNKEKQQRQLLLLEEILFPIVETVVVYHFPSVSPFFINR
jgi:hypothetical protein|tara:strand:+ start:133 stop:366 length:234 start_codon:yes stop_codon:yes gene_type:complete